MRLIVIIFLVFLAAYGVMQIDQIDPDNYVKMYLGNYVVEIKVLGLLLLLIGLVMVLYFALWLIRVIWRSPKTVAKWQGKRNHSKAEEQLGAGYLSLIKGDWKKAENLLTSKTQHSRLPYVNYLVAAQAAQQQGRIEQRDEYLSAAYKAAPKERLAIGLTKARLHQQAGQLELALATLQDIETEGKKNPQYTAMLLQAHEENKDWQQAHELLPVARKQKALPDEILEQIDTGIHLNGLKQASKESRQNGDSSVLSGAWRALPKEQKKMSDNVAVYAQALIDCGEPETAEKIIRTALNNDWSEELVAIYGQLPSDNPAKALRRVEGWLLARPENAQLSLAAGRLAKLAGNKELAIQYLQDAVRLAQLPQAYGLLGEVYESANESGKALQLYRDGIAAAAGLSDDAKLLEAADD